MESAAALLSAKASKSKRAIKWVQVPPTQNFNFLHCGNGELLVLHDSELCSLSDDDLCRLLNTGEQRWLGQNALICLTVRLDAKAASAAWTPEAVAAAVAAARARQPFLQVCVDAAALRFKIAEPTRVTFEALAAAPDTDYDGAVRAVARRQLDLGVDRAQTLARLHVVTTAAATHLILIGDHLALDARSLSIFAQAVVAHVLLAPAAPVAAIDRLPFVDWTTRIPSLSLPPFAAPDSAMLVVNAVAPEDVAAAASVVGRVSVLSADTFAGLKAGSKARGLTLNGPLMAAFLLAVGDVSRDQKRAADVAAGAADAAASPASVTVRTLCAVDLRGQLAPPVAADFMNNSASIVSAHATFTPPAAQGGGGGEGGDLWAVAAGLTARLKEGIAGGEGFRLHDITQRMAFAELGPLFAVPCLWSNVGHVAGALAGAEVLITGPGSNPILTGHCAEAGGRCSLTVTVAPAFHPPQTAEAVAARFAHHVAALAASGASPCPCA